MFLLFLLISAYFKYKLYVGETRCPSQLLCISWEDRDRSILITQQHLWEHESNGDLNSWDSCTNLKEPREPRLQNPARLPRIHPEEKRGYENLQLT